MVPGLNTNVERGGAEFHVQTEDLGRSKPILQSLVYYGGQVVTVLEYTYEALATSEDYSADEVRRMLSKQHYRLVSEIDAGVYDVVDPNAIASESEEQARQRERILDYLESALTYDHKPCLEAEAEPSDEPAPPPASAVQPMEPSEARVEAEAASIEESMQVVQAPRSGRPAVDSRGTPVADAPGPRRLVVIRPDREGQGGSEERDERHESEIPQVIAVLHGDETPQAVAVRQALDVKVVTGHERGVEQVLDRLDETLEQVEPVPGRRRSGRWIVVAATLPALVLIAVGWLWLSGKTGPAVEPPASQIVENVQSAIPEASPVEPPRVVPEPVTEAAPEPVTEPLPEVAETPAAVPPASAEEPTAVAQEDLPPATTGGGASEASAEGGETVASLTPAVPELPSGTPDPVERLEPEPVQDEAPVAPPEKPATPVPQVRTGSLVDLASVDKAPKATSRPFPEYPKRARKKKQQGLVAMSLLIDETGNVAEIRLADGVVESELSAAAIATARSWKYTPALVGPHKVRVWKPVIVHFVMDDQNTSRVRVQE